MTKQTENTGKAKENGAAEESQNTVAPMLDSDPSIVAELKWEDGEAPEVKTGRSDDIRRLATALARAQGEMSNAKKNRENKAFSTSYADLGAVIDAVRDPMARHQIARIQIINFNETETWLDSMLMHGPSGQYVTARYPLPKGAGMKPQDFVSAITYARRTSMSVMTGIASEDDDDDGNIAADIARNEPHSEGPRAPTKAMQAADQWWPYAIRVIAKQPTREAMTAWEEKETVSLVSLAKLLPERHVEVMAAIQKRYEELTTREEGSSPGG